MMVIMKVNMAPKSYLLCLVALAYVSTVLSRSVGDSLAVRQLQVSAIENFYLDDADGRLGRIMVCKKAV